MERRHVRPKHDSVCRFSSLCPFWHPYISSRTFVSSRATVLDLDIVDLLVAAIGQARSAFYSEGTGYHLIYLCPCNFRRPLSGVILADTLLVVSSTSVLAVDRKVDIEARSEIWVSFSAFSRMKPHLGVSPP